MEEEGAGVSTMSAIIANSCRGMISFQDHKKPDWAIQMSSDGAPPSPRSPRKVNGSMNYHIFRLKRGLQGDRCGRGHGFLLIFK